MWAHCGRDQISLTHGTRPWGSCHGSTWRRGGRSTAQLGAVVAVPRLNLAPLRVFALDTLTGERKQELAVQAGAGGLTFDIGHACGTIYYEIAAQ